MKDKLNISRKQNRRLALCLFAASIAGVWNVPAGQAEGNASEFLRIRDIAHFSRNESERGITAVSISDSKQPEGMSIQQGEVSPQEKMAWGQALLDDLGRMWNATGSVSVCHVENVLNFRDWCIGARGKGNLQLAIASEETAVELLFQGLVSNGISAEDAGRLLARCSQGAPTAEYWFHTLAFEDHPFSQSVTLNDNEAEYKQLGVILNYVWNNGIEEGIVVQSPNAIGLWERRLDDFVPLELAVRTMSLARRKIALEVCLAIQNACGKIPTEASEFREAAQTYADNILTNGNRLTSWMAPGEVWNFWHKAFDSTQRPAQD